MSDTRKISELTVDEFTAKYFPTLGHPATGTPLPDVMPTPTPYYPPAPVAKNWRNVFELMNMEDPNERARYTTMNAAELAQFSIMQRELPEAEQKKFFLRY